LQAEMQSIVGRPTTFNRDGWQRDRVVTEEDAWEPPSEGL
jgi:hypothetical protein